MIQAINEAEVRAFLGEIAAIDKQNDRLAEALSALDNYVDPRDAYRDENGIEWSGFGAGSGGKNRPPSDFAGFANEQELTDARELCRRMFTYSEFAINGHKVRINYAVDSGFMFKAVAKDTADSSEAMVEQLQEFIDEFTKRNKWPTRQRECVMRWDRDGEFFRRIFKQADGTTAVRWIEPWQVTSNGITESDDLYMGIENEPGDAETPVRYYLAEIAGNSPVPVNAAEIQHVKANVDMTVRRGVPLFWAAAKNARRVSSVLRNMGVKNELAAALCVNRRHSTGTTASAASSFASGNATLSRTSSVTGQTTLSRSVGAGTFLDTSKNTDYEALNIADGIDQMVMGLDAMLRALAAAAGLPEFMLTSNAANGNYSSTMVAEGPAVRTFRDIQTMLKTADLELLDIAVEWAIEKGVLPQNILELVEIQVELPQLATRDPASEATANKTYRDMKIISPQTLSSKLGLEYDQEQENIKAHDAAYPPEQPMLGNPNDPNRAAAVGAMRGIMRTPESMDAFKALLESEYRSVTEHMGPGAHSNGTSQDVHGDGGGATVDAKKKITDSAEFKAWFGDSKVVDASGEPLVVYHGTLSDRQIDVMQSHSPVDVVKMNGKEYAIANSWDMGNDYSEMPDGLHYGAVSDARSLGAEKALAFRQESAAKLESELGRPPSNDTKRHIADLERMVGSKLEFSTESRPSGDGIYFTPDDSYSYIRNAKQALPVYLSIKNPIYLNHSEIESAGQSWRVQKYIEQGYDGAIAATNPKDLRTTGWNGSTQIIAFHPTQIKSATGNRGTFDPKSPKITEHLGPGNHPNGSSQDVHGSGGSGKGVQYDLEPLNAKTDAAPEYAKSDKAAAILDSWTTPARGSREGDYAKARSEMEAWVNGTKNQGMDDLYAETQAGLASRGIKTEKVFRGIALPVDHPLAKAIAEGRVGPNDSVLLEGATVASWSDSHPAAHSFAQSHKIEAGASGKETYGVVLERVADAKDVLATHRVHRGFLAGEGEYVVRNTGKMKVRISSVTLPFGVKESESSQEHEFNVSECDNQRGIEKPKG